MKKFKIVKRQRGGSNTGSGSSSSSGSVPSEKKKKIKLSRPQKNKIRLSKGKQSQHEEEEDEDEEMEDVVEEEGEDEIMEAESESAGNEEGEAFTKRFQLGHLEGSIGEFGIDFVEHLVTTLIGSKNDADAVNWCKWLMCSGQDPHTALAKLSNGSESHSICGKDLDKNSWQYQCTTCQNDDTCVMCGECFKDSDHTDHKVQRIKVSSGTCDCGDPEAWKPSGFCSKHRGPGEGGQVLASIPSEMLTPLTTTLAAVMDVALTGLGQVDNTYAYAREHEPKSPVSNMWAVMMFNDEDHSFDDVINRLMTAVPTLHHIRASNIALRVDALGQCVVTVGTKKECEKVMKSLISKKPPLICTVTDDVNLIQEERIGVLLDMLGELCESSDALRKLCGSILTLPVGETSFDKKPTTTTTTTSSNNNNNNNKRADLIQTRLDILFSCYESVTPFLRLPFGNWVLSLLKDHAFKKEMGVGYAKWYPFLMDRYSHLLETKNTPLELTVQIFTMRDTAYTLAVEHNLVGVILKTMLAELEKNAVPEDPNFKKIDIFHFQPVQIEPVMRDLNYLLSTGNIAHLIVQPDLLKDFLSLHERGQGIQPNLRELNAHVEMDQDTFWMRALNFNSDIMNQQETVVKLLTVPELLTAEAAVFTDLQSWLNSTQLDFYEVKGKAIVAPPDVVTDGISFSITFPLISSSILTLTCKDIPLHRLWSCIIQQATSQNADTTMQVYQIQDVKLALSLLEHPLRIFVLVAQVFAGLWVRNGYGLLNQAVGYREGLKLQHLPFPLKTMAYARDLFLVQALATVIPVEHFMEVLVNRFELESFFSATPDLSETPLYDPVKLLSVAEQFLELLILLITHRDYVSDISDEEATRDLLIHALFLLGNCTYSKLVNHLGTANSDRYSPHFEKVLKEVANFKEPQGVEQGKYELKDEYYPKINRFFWEYSRREREVVDELYEKKKGNPQPPTLPSLRQHFARLKNILISDKLHDIVVNETPKSHSIALLARTLYLLQLQIMEVWEGATQEQVSKSLAKITAVREVTVTPSSPPSTVATTSASIFSLLMQVRTKYPQLKSYVMWILEKLFAAEPNLKNDFAASVNVEEEAKNKRKEMQEAARKKLLQQFTNQQMEFAKTMEGVQMEDEDDGTTKAEEAVCILCRESSPLYCESKPLGAIMSILESKIIAKGRPSKLVKCCGHIIHVDCCCKYWSSLKEKRSRGIEFEGIGILSLEDGEFACPICKTVSEFVVPIVALRGQATAAPLPSLAIPDQPNELLTGIEVKEPYEEDRPAVISTISPNANSKAATALCVGTACHIEFAGRSNTHSLTEFVKEKDIQNLRFLLNSTRTAVAGFSRTHERLVMKLSPSLDLDIISELVTLCAKVPVVDNTLFATKFASLFRALFFVGLAQCVALASPTTDSTNTTTTTSTAPPSSEGSPTVAMETTTPVTKFIEPNNNNSHSTSNSNNTSVFGEAFLRRVHELAGASLPSSSLESKLPSLHTFTRTAAILYSALFSIPLPTISNTKEEFSTLLTYLNFPTALLQSLPPQFEPFITDLLLRKPKAAIPALDAPTPFSLINLPNSFYAFGEDPHAKVVCKKCTSNIYCKMVAKHNINAAVCLVCGDYVCPMSTCCGNEITTHSKECCGDFGAYLSLDGQGVVLLVFKGITGIYSAYPYLDPHGEEDPKLSRGLPLNLDKGRVENLRDIVVTHTTSSKVLAKTFRRNEM